MSIFSIKQVMLRISLMIVTSLVAFVYCHAQPKAGWKLTWNDEFNYKVVRKELMILLFP
jgi:hypothetical protein